MSEQLKGLEAINNSEVIIGNKAEAIITPEEAAQKIRKELIDFQNTHEEILKTYGFLGEERLGFEAILESAKEDAQTTERRMMSQ